MPAVSHSWSFILLRRAPVPTLTIFDANSTPMVWEENIRPTSGQRVDDQIQGESYIRSSQIDAIDMTCTFRKLVVETRWHIVHTFQRHLVQVV